jgi:hypothetical protein
MEPSRPWRLRRQDVIGHLTVQRKQNPSTAPIRNPMKTPANSKAKTRRNKASPGSVIPSAGTELQQTFRGCGPTGQGVCLP